MTVSNKLQGLVPGILSIEENFILRSNKRNEALSVTASSIPIEVCIIEF